MYGLFEVGEIHRVRRASMRLQACTFQFLSKISNFGDRKAREEKGGGMNRKGRGRTSSITLFSTFGLNSKRTMCTKVMVFLSLLCYG